MFFKDGLFIHIIIKSRFRPEIDCIREIQTDIYQK